MAESSPPVPKFTILLAPYLRALRKPKIGDDKPHQPSGKLVANAPATSNMSIPNPLGIGGGGGAPMPLPGNQQDPNIKAVSSPLQPLVRKRRLGKSI
jgi:hypothetical protein